MGNWRAPRVAGPGVLSLKRPGDRLKPCEERPINCEEDGKKCCALTVCNLCLRWEVYDEVDETGTAVSTGGDHTGSVGGMQWVSYWRSYPDCEYVVEIDGYEAAVFTLCNDYSGSGNEYSEISCRDLSGEFEYTDGSTTGTLSFRPLEVERLRRRAANPGGTCDVDVCLVFDHDFRNEAGIQDIQNGALQEFVDRFEAEADTARFALVSFSRDKSTTDAVLGTSAAFLTAVDALVKDPSTGEASPQQHRHSDAAMTKANALDWQADNRLIILCNQGVPDRSTPTTAGNANELTQLAEATTAAGNDIEVHTISLTTVPSQGFFPRVESVNAATAANGNGTHRTSLLDGDDDFNGGYPELPDKLLELARTLICNDGDCADFFCGNSDCASLDACISVNKIVYGSGEDCTGCAAMVRTSTQDCELGITDPGWSATVTCGEDSYTVTVSLGRDDDPDSYTYRQCVVSGSVTGSVSATLEETVVGSTNPLSVTFPAIEDGDDTITFSVTGKTCADCCEEPTICLECCDSIPPNPPATLGCRIMLGDIVTPVGDPEPDTSCWQDLDIDISFLYDVDDDTDNACNTFGSTRRADCIGNLLDGEFDESCCSGGQWVGSGTNSCATISVCLIPCATIDCSELTPPEGKQYASWDVHVAVNGAPCGGPVGQCLICHDEIVMSVEGFGACVSDMIELLTSTGTLIIDIFER